MFGIFVFSAPPFWMWKLFMEKYGNIIMNQRIVANKHINNHLDVSPVDFKNLGQIVVCNQPGLEGIFIINSENEVIRVASNALSGSTVIDETVERYLINNFFSKDKTLELIADAKDEVNERIDGVDERLDGIDERIDGLDEKVDGIDDRVYALEVSGSSADIDEEAVKRIVANELSKIITSAGTVSISDHVFLNRDQYDELLENGYATIDGQYVVYSDAVYYCIYEGELPPPSGDTPSYDYDEETGMMTLHDVDFDAETGMFALDDAEIREDGIVILPEGGEGGGGDDEGTIDFDEDTDIPTATTEITDGGFMVLPSSMSGMIITE